MYRVEVYSTPYLAGVSYGGTRLLEQQLRWFYDWVLYSIVVHHFHTCMSYKTDQNAYSSYRDLDFTMLWRYSFYQISLAFTRLQRSNFYHVIEVWHSFTRLQRSNFYQVTEV